MELLLISDIHGNLEALDTLGSNVEFFDVDYDVRQVIGKIEERMPCSDELVAILRRGY